MRAKTVADVGAVVRSARHAQGVTQAELARRLHVSRDWVVRLEQGHPRLQAQHILDALVVLNVEVTLTAAHTPTAGQEVPDHAGEDQDPFAFLTAAP